ncbi:MAG: hypothetical protein MJE77_06780 [Proteobacteria bacterium]|nr:hypothetical protein [Pseudomonadota bacterium]
MEQKVSNLCVRAQAAMLRAALFLMTVSLALSVILVRVDVSSWYRLALFVPFALASTNLYQALFRT